MQLTRLEATGFRNLAGFAEFGPGLNIFYGDNAQGKTNWLEAIYVVGNTKSFRTSQLKECIAFDAEACILRGEVLRGSLVKEIQLALTESSKELYVNGKRDTVVRYIGNLDVFVFSLEEMTVIRGEPAERRRFLDRGIVTMSPAFLNTISEYNHVIRQKNKLLKEAAESDNPAAFRDQIEAWNEELIQFGSAIHNARVDYVEKLNHVLERNDYGHAIFGAERISVRYRSQLEGKGEMTDFAALFRERLAVRLQAEIAAGHSLIGPHRDDLEILADSREVARFGSAGQQRSALLLLDLAQVSIYNSIYEESPILLIDDIDAELDRGRIEALLLEIEGRAQTFVSTSRRAIANRYRDRAAVFYVEGGRAIRETRENVNGLTAAGDEQTHEPGGSDDLERAVREMIIGQKD
ncbi:MAG TPA: DNA replication and repair protein RecF [Blastocatellia bacterium]|nr:DNA replication and repair protein RecF [Blastocatellia bacterium]